MHSSILQAAPFERFLFTLYSVCHSRTANANVDKFVQIASKKHQMHNTRTCIHALQNTQNNCHKWLSHSFRVHQIRFRPRWPAGGAYSAPQTPSWFKGRDPTSKGKGMGVDEREEARRRPLTLRTWLRLCRRTSTLHDISELACWRVVQEHSRLYFHQAGQLKPLRT